MTDRIAYDSVRTLSDLGRTRHFMCVWVDKLTSNCLGLHSISLSNPDTPAKRSGTATAQPPSVSNDGASRGSSRAGAIVSTTRRRTRMRMRRTIGLSLVLLLASATAMAKQAPSGDDQPVPSIKAKPAKSATAVAKPTAKPATAVAKPTAQPATAAAK